MRSRFLAGLVAAAMATAAGVPAAAAPNEWVQPPKKLPRVNRDEQVNSLDFLFGALKAAPDDETAKAIEQRIWASWMQTRSDTASLLMT